VLTNIGSDDDSKYYPLKYAAVMNNYLIKDFYTNVSYIPPKSRSFPVFSWLYYYLLMCTDHLSQTTPATTLFDLNRSHMVQQNYGVQFRYS